MLKDDGLLMPMSFQNSSKFLLNELMDVASTTDDGDGREPSGIAVARFFYSLLAPNQQSRRSILIDLYSYKYQTYMYTVPIAKEKTITKKDKNYT